MIPCYSFTTTHLDHYFVNGISSISEVCDSRTQTEASEKVECIHQCDSVALLQVLKDSACL